LERLDVEGVAESVDSFTSDASDLYAPHHVAVVPVREAWTVVRTIAKRRGAPTQGSRRRLVLSHGTKHPLLMRGASSMGPVGAQA
jgi:hypothetical protein